MKRVFMLSLAAAAGLVLSGAPGKAGPADEQFCLGIEVRVGATDAVTNGVVYPCVLRDEAGVPTDACAGAYVIAAAQDVLYDWGCVSEVLDVSRPPGVPDVPEVPGAPEAPGVPGLPTLPDLPSPPA